MRFLKPVHFVLATCVAATAVVSGPTLWAQDRIEARPERPQVAAATAEAVANMRDEIERATVGRITVGDLVRRCHGEEELTQALNRAELLGGPRWVDNDTCQVQLEMSGTRVARIIEHIAANSHDRSPASPADVQQLAVDWQRRTFTGTGSSTAFNRAERVRPRLAANSPWSAVSEAERQKVLGAAKEDAIGRVVDSIKPIEISKGKTVGDSLAQPEVHKAVMEWLAVRPVIRIEYHLDLSIEITLAGTPGGLFDTVRHAVTERSDLPIPRDEAGWALVRRDFEAHMAIPVGRASANGAATMPATPAPVARGRWSLPDRAPEWVGQHVDVEAVAEAADSKLRGAREAETSARRKLVAEVNSLPLNRDLTVGKAAETDPRVHEAVLAALEKARTVNTDYTRKNGVVVSMQLDLQDVWDAIRANE